MTVTGEEFGTIRRVGFDAVGNLHVFDRLAARIVVVGPNGDFLREFGRRGEGPGEFQLAEDMVVMSDGRVAVADMGHRAYHIFDSGGDLERMVRMGRVPYVGQMYPEAGGESVVRGARTLAFSFRFEPGELTAALPDARTVERIKEVPVVRDLRTSWSGQIWVLRRGDEPVSDGPIDILTADGRYAGSFRTGATRLPDAFGPDGLAAFLERDEIDVPTVVVKRLPRLVN